MKYFIFEYTGTRGKAGFGQHIRISLCSVVNETYHFSEYLQGRDKMPAYWLGAFFCPQALLAMLKQDRYRQYCSDRSGNFDQLVFQTELTARDKDHVSGNVMLNINSLSKHM